MLSGNSSTASSLTIAMTFAVGTDPDIALINVQNRVQSAIQLLPEEVRRQGVTIQKSAAELPEDPVVRLAGRALRRSVRLELRDAERHRRAAPHSGHRQRPGIRRARLLDSHLAAAGQAHGARPDARRRRGGRARAEHAVRGRPARRRAHRRARRSDALRDHAVPAVGSRAVRAHRADATGDNGQVVRLQRRRARRARRTRLWVRALALGKARHRRGAPARARRERARVRGGRLREDGGARARGFPEGLEWSIPYDTSKYVRTSMREVALHVRRGARARVLRRLGVPL